MTVRLLAAALLFCLSLLPSQAQGQDAVGLTEILRIPELIAVLRDEGLSHGDDLEQQLFPGQGNRRWDQAADKAYDAPELLRRFDAAFTARLAGDVPAQDRIAEFFGSARGQRILELEIDARRALLDDGVTEAATVAFAAMRAGQDPRVALLTRFADANDLIEQNVSAALNASFAFYQGMSQGGAFGAARMPEADMLADVWAQEAETRAETEDWLFPFLMLAYGPLSDADLLAYIEFSETDASRRMNAALFGAFDEVFSTLSRDLGRAAAEVLAGQDI